MILAKQHSVRVVFPSRMEAIELITKFIKGNALVQVMSELITGVDLSEVEEHFNNIIRGEWVKQDEKHKYVAGLVFKLLILLMVCLAAVGILRLFEVLSKTISI